MGSFDSLDNTPNTEGRTWSNMGIPVHGYTPAPKELSESWSYRVCGRVGD